ncbi:MAG: fused MFS/spermidine synthase [Treponema sp.]|jgi:hypothetical protein|nr:fused MFS/spermidine synthase [Treponema sp.]
MNILAPIAIFLGSALLFFLQPMVGRTLLPAFGGSAAVWSVCLATFQMLLVGGYAYANTLSGMDERKQRRIHAALLALAAAWAFALALAALPWARTGLHAGERPALEVLLVALLGPGVPYLVLSAGSSLLQSWAHSGQKSRSVYRLYAVSNLGSFLGLFAYPFLMEPFVPLHLQWIGWSAALVLYLLLVASLALQKKPAALPDQSGLPAQTAAAQLPRLLTGEAWWYVLPGISTFILVSTTNHLSMDVAPVPLLWAILLGAFLLSYVAGFSRAGERLLYLWRLLAFGALTGSVLARQADNFLLSVGAGMAFVFFGGTFLHSWLYSIRPEGARLTRFYLGVAAGGAAGGMFVSFAAPLVFSGIWEYPAALFMCALAGLFFTVCSWRQRTLRRVFTLVLNGSVILACVLASILAVVTAGSRSQTVVLNARNFYGSIRVEKETMELDDGSAEVFSLINGGTMHGLQVRYEHGREGRFTGAPASYYSPHGGGMAFRFSPKWLGAIPKQLTLRELSAFERPQGLPMRVAVIGLGTGAMSVWGREGDDWTFFEINPLVDKVARDDRYFTYLRDSRARVRTKIGDARLLLERERAEGEPLYDILVADAYTGDYVPMQLATGEAFRLYADRLAPDGVLVIHISNWHLNLLPLCKAAARALNMNAVGVMADGNESDLTENTLWVFLTRHQVTVDAAGSGAGLVDFSQVGDIRLPMDDWGGLQSLISFDFTIPMLGEGETANGKN